MDYPVRRCKEWRVNCDWFKNGIHNHDVQATACDDREVYQMHHWPSTSGPKYQGWTIEELSDSQGLSKSLSFDKQ